MVVAASASAQDRVIGLLALPQVFGSSECAAFEPEEIPLYSAINDAKPIATIRVDQNWSFAPHGGCEGLEVRVHRGEERHELPTREYDYEMPAAIVLDHSSGWFKVRLDKDSAWIKASPVDHFMPLADLFEEFMGVTAIDKSFSGRLVDAPGRPATAASPQVVGPRPVQVIEVRSVFGQMWAQVEVFDHSICSAAENGPPQVVARGWMLLHGSNGEPTIWFASRGC
jgi:hypothetical protein